jgi:hypothetical protein
MLEVQPKRWPLFCRKFDVKAHTTTKNIPRRFRSQVKSSQVTSKLEAQEQS